MKRYKGYYIDGNIFTCEADIDAHLKAAAIRSYQNWCELFAHYAADNRADMAMVACAEADKVAVRLVNDHGLTWSDVEALETKTLTA